jgi:putative tricarboxylic transport membrane protein
MTSLKSFAAKAALAALTAGLLSAPALALDNVKFMIGANPGGGWDQTGRALGKAMVDAGTAKTVSFENKGGAGGTIGLAQFVNASKGDGNALIVTGSVMVGAIVQNKPPVTLANATPIARLFTDYNIFVVPANSPLKSMKDVIEMMKKDPASVKWGGGSRGSTDHISVAMIAREAGVDAAKVNYVPFKGGGEATAAVLGGHVTVGTSGYSEFIEFVNAGKMRAIGVTGPKRMGDKKVPTLLEQGINVEIGNSRGVYGAPGITAEQRKALTEAVVKATKTKGWNDALAKNDWVANVATGVEFEKWVEEEHARLRALMVKTGML